MCVPKKRIVYLSNAGSSAADSPTTHWFRDIYKPAKADQVEQPMDYSLDNQFDSHQISSFSSGDHGKWSLVIPNFLKTVYIYTTIICFIIHQGEPMDCSVVIHSTSESNRSGKVLSQDQLSTYSKTENLRIQGAYSARTSYLQEHEGLYTDMP